MGQYQLKREEEIEKRCKQILTHLKWIKNQNPMMEDFTDDADQALWEARQLIADFRWELVKTAHVSRGAKS